MKELNWSDFTKQPTVDNYLGLKQAERIIEDKLDPPLLPTLLKTIQRDIFNTGWTIAWRIYGSIKYKKI